MNMGCYAGLVVDRDAAAFDPKSWSNVWSYDLVIDGYHLA